MSKFSIKHFAENAFSDIGRSIEDAIETVHKNVRNAMISNEALKSVYQYISTLEEIGDAIEDEGVRNATTQIVKELKTLAKIIKKDPKGSIEVIENLVQSFRQKSQALTEGFEMQIMTQNYEDAIRACQSAKDSIMKASEDEKKTDSLEA